MPYREPLATPPVAGPSARTVPWAAFSVMLLVIARLYFVPRSLWREWIADGGAGATVLLGCTGLVASAILYESSRATPERPKTRIALLLAPALVSVVAWAGLLFPLRRPPPGEFFEWTPAFARITRSTALLTLGGVSITIVALLVAAAGVTALSSAVPVMARPASLRRSWAWFIVSAVVWIIVALQTQGIHWSSALQTMLTPVSTLSIALVGVAIARVRVLRYCGVPIDWGAVAMTGASSAIAVAAASRLDQFGTEALCSFHCFGSSNALYGYRAHMWSLLDGRHTLWVGLMFAVPAAIAFVVATAHARSAPRVTRDPAIRQALASVASALAAITALHALHAPWFRFALHRFDRPPTFDTRDVALPRASSTGACECTRTLAVGRTSIWHDGAPIARLDAITSPVGRLALQRHMQAHWEAEQFRDVPADLRPIEPFATIALDRSHPARVMASVLDAIRGNGAVQGHLVFALTDDALGPQAAWLRDVRRPDGAIGFYYGSSGPPRAVRVYVGRHTLAVSMPSADSSATVSEPTDLLTLGKRVEQIDPRPAVEVIIDPEVPAAWFTQVLAAIATDAHWPNIRIARVE